MGEEKADSARRIMPNVISNLAFMLINFAMGLILTPYYLDTLGAASYAIIPVATSVTSYIVLISDSLSSTVSRYLTIEMNSDRTGANRTFNTAVWGFTGIVVAAIPVVMIIAILSPSIFDIATNTVISVQMLFVFILASVLISVWCNNYITVLYSKNRIDLMNVAKITQVTLQIVLVVVFFTAVSKSVEYVGLAYLLAAVVYALVSIMLARRVCPELRLARGGFDGGHFREIASVGGWALINSLGNLLFMQASLLVVNIIAGAELGADFGILVTLVSAVSALMDTLATVFAPIIYRAFAEDRRDDMRTISSTAVKVVGLVMSMPVAFLCAFSSQILTVWIGAEYIDLSVLVWATMYVMIGTGAITPTYSLTTAYLRIKIPGLVTLGVGLINVIGAVLVLSFTDFGLVGVALVWSLTMFFKNCIFNPWYNGKVAGMSATALHVKLLYGYVSFAVLSAFYCLIGALVDIPASWTVLIVLGVVLLAIHMLVILRFLLTKAEREMFLSCLPAKVSGVLHKMI